jgi:hypothetical protein
LDLDFCFLCVPQRPQRETNIVVLAPASMLLLRLCRFVSFCLIFGFNSPAAQAG